MFSIILSDISNYLSIYFGRSLRAGIVCSLIYACINLMLRKKGRYEATTKHIIVKTVVFCIAVMYFYMVLGVTFLCREPVFEKKISLVPFTTHPNNSRLEAFTYENVIMFIPYGFIIPILLGKLEKWYICLGVGIVSSLLIETLQYLTMRGYAQLEDIILNSFGMMVGWLLITLINNHKKAKKDKAK